ncbi:locustin-like [Bacillus rossius redtenbacheri]|uniref:locustin-like n=1 Tax=Bacillus rossius redtenbacheri TaxID=93214 RepID=UPI002FDDCCDF
MQEIYTEECFVRCLNDASGKMAANGGRKGNDAPSHRALIAPTCPAGVLAAGAWSASCPCPQCIIVRPVCAYSYSTHQRRSFSSECEMRCYNKCYDTDYSKISYGLKCV